MDPVKLTVMLCLPPPPPGRELRMYMGRGTSGDWEMAFVEHVIFKSDLFGRCVAAD